MSTSSSSSTSTPQSGTKMQKALDFLETKRQTLESMKSIGTADKAYLLKIKDADPSTYPQLFAEDSKDHGKLVYAAATMAKHDLLTYIFAKSLGKPVFVNPAYVDAAYIFIILDGAKTIDFAKPMMESNLLTLPDYLEKTLQMAIVLKKPELTKWLITKGANINNQSSIALVYAASAGDLETARMLVEMKILVDENNMGEILRGAASSGVVGFIDLVYHLIPTFKKDPSLILTKEVKQITFSTACYCRHLDFIKVLIAKGFANQSDFNMNLLNSCKFGYTDVAQLLLANGADAGLQANMPMKYAVIRGDKVLAELLIKHGVDTTVMNSFIIEEAIRDKDSATVAAMLGDKPASTSSSTSTATGEGKTERTTTSPAPTAAPSPVETSMDKNFYSACLIGDVKTVSLLTASHDFTLPVLKNGFQYASMSSHYELSNFLASLIMKDKKQ